jgi:hypothetical protein
MQKLRGILGSRYQHLAPIHHQELLRGHVGPEAELLKHEIHQQEQLDTNKSHSTSLANGMPLPVPKSVNLRSNLGRLAMSES